MMRTFLLILTWTGCLFNATAAEKNINVQSQLKQKISQAITKFEQTSREHWAYQVSRYENEEGEISSSIESFTPGAEQAKQWTLLSINGEKPTERQAKEFVDSKLKQAEKQEKGANYALKLGEIINLDSLELESETDSHLKAGFKVYLSKLGEDAKGKLQGVLSYNKQVQFIESITIINTADFSPMFSAKISDLKLSFTFISINNKVLPKQQELQMKGSFAFFTEIDEVSTDTFSKYHYKGS